ncbi:MAG: hypothetical protein KJO25_06630 [Bacteroidia bacterium]|nr:hypothetical protein [Bacteroidia bacterium]
MSEKQNIDKLFRDKLDDFEATPSSSVWDNISGKLNKDSRERKVIPLWFKIAGIAGIIVILISLGSLVLNSNNDEQPPQPVVETESGVENETDTSKDVNGEETSVNSEILKEIADSEEENLPENARAEQDAISESVQGQSRSEEKRANQIITDKPSLINDENATVSGSDKNDAPDSSALKKRSDAVVNNENQPVNEDSSVNRDQNIEKKQAEAILSDEKSEETEQLAQIDETKTEDVKVNEVENAEVKDDLEEAIAEQQEEESELDEPEEKGDKWRIAPNIAPVYFGSIGKGSAIDDQFVNNSLSGEINMSYGILASYEISDKLRVRSGINRMRLGSKTNDVIVYNNIDPQDDVKPLRNVVLNNASSDLLFLTANELNLAQVPGVVADNIQSSIDQELGFIEIPLELEYKLSDKGFDISVIGGMSALFLNDNAVYSSLQGNRTELGKATNVNSTSFSANLGLGFNIKASDRLDLNLEPVFKYHLNTFKNTSGDFNPFNLGIYTGFSFKF